MRWQYHAKAMAKRWQSDGKAILMGWQSDLNAMAITHDAPAIAQFGSVSASLFTVSEAPAISTTSAGE
jgi:hypothetical protein